MKIGDILIEEDKVTVKMKKMKTDVLNEGDVFTFASGERIFYKGGFGEVNQQVYVVMLAQIPHWGGFKGLDFGRQGECTEGGWKMEE